MRFVRVALVFSAALTAYAQSGLEGQVVNPATGGPARNATVMLISMPIRQTGIAGSTVVPIAINQVSADTDGDGHFSFANLPAGEYHVRVQRRGAPGAGVDREIQLYLGEGQQLKDIVFSMPTQPVVSGKVLDEFGEPVERAQVSLLQPQSTSSRGGRQWNRIANGITNDLGEYRLILSSPGDYLVCASYPNIGRMQPVGQPLPDKPEMAYVETCHPNATETGSATMLTVGPAGVAGIDVQMKRLPTLRIRGTLVSPPEAKDRRASPTLQPADGPDAGSPIRNLSAIVSQDGTFEIFGVKPGRYILGARLMLPGVRANQYVAAMPLVVTDKSLDGVTLELAAPKQVRGTVTFDGNSPPPPGRMQVLVNSLDGSIGMSQGIVTDGAFTLTNVPPGRSTLTLNAMGRWYVKYTLYDGKQIPSDGVDLTTGGEVEIVLSDDGVPLSGAVANAAGQPLYTGMISILAMDGPQPMSRAASTGTTGTFSFPALRPGVYKLYAWEAVDMAQAQNIAYLRNFVDLATTVKLEAGNPARVTLTPIPGAATGIGPDTESSPFVHVKGRLEGQVLSAVTGLPVANTEVALRGSGVVISNNNRIYRGSYTPPSQRPGGIRTATSDAQGRFEFADIDPGVYYPFTASAGSMPSTNNVSRDAIIVGEGQHVRNAIVKLSPAVNITGKVVDEKGVPLPNTRLSVLGIDYSSGKPVLTATNQGADTDERGEFKIDLPAGDYTLGARYLDHTPPDFLPAQPLPKVSDFGYPVTYYPATPNADAAQPLTLDAEGNANAKLTLTTTPMWRVRGQVVNPSGPLPRLTVTVFANDAAARTMLGSWFVALNPDGNFEVSGLPNGTYTIVAKSTGPGARSAAVLPVEVRGKSVGGLKLELGAARESEATIITDDQSPLPADSIWLQVTPIDDRSGANMFQARGSRVQLHGLLPIAYSVAVKLPPTCDCYVKSIQYGGYQMPPTSAIVSGGEPFVVIIGTGLGSVEGTVVNAAGKPVAGAAVVLAPKSAELTAIKRVEADGAGHFAFPGNPPGDYKLLAWADGAMNPMQVPMLLTKNDTQSKPVRLDRAGHVTILLTAIPH